MKLTWRADTSASIARSSWLSLRRCLHWRINEPIGGVCTGAAAVTGSVLPTRPIGTTTSQVIAVPTCRRHGSGVDEPTTDKQIPRWLRFVLISDRAGSAWFIGLGFFFAPVLAVLSPWPAVTAVMWAIIGLFGLWLGLLGIAMATGLAVVMRSNTATPEECWRSIIDF